MTTPSIHFAVATLAAVAGLSMAQAAPQPSPSTLLAGKTSREWVFKTTHIFMGKDAKCEGDGEVYRFSVNRKLVVDRCEAGKVVSKSHTWTLSQAGPLDTLLTFDGKAYRLIFSDKNRRMVLRTVAETKAEPTVSREFRLSKD